MTQIVSEKAIIREMDAETLEHLWEYKYRIMQHNYNCGCFLPKTIRECLKLIQSQYFQQTGKHLQL